LSKLSRKAQIPDQILSKLKKQWIDNSLQNMIYLAELETVLREAAKDSLPVVVLKSIPLLETAYQDFGMRVLNDLDILVRPEHLPKMESLLSDLGYSYHVTNLGNHITYSSSKTGILIEVHWDFVNSQSPVQKYAFKLDMEEFWSLTQVCEIAETEALTLCPEHLIIYLCVHLFKEDFGSFKWLGDISGVLHYYQNVIDWEVFCDYVTKFRLNKIVYYILDFMIQRLDVPVPRRALRSIRPKLVRSIDRKLINPIADSRFIERYKPVRYLTVIADIRDKIAALTEIMTYIYRQFVNHRANDEW